MFSGATLRLAMLLAITLAVMAGFFYISGLRADLAIAEENSKKMTAAVEQQQSVIANIRAEQKQIVELNKQLADTVKAQNKDLKSLQDRFTVGADGNKRDLGAIAVQKPESIERAINKGTVNAMRCVEIASGSPLTEAEKNAKLPNEINKECPALANPNYKPAASN